MRKEHSPNHIPTRIGKLQQIIDESDPLLVEVLMKKNLVGIETSIKTEKRHREILIELNKNVLESDRRILAMNAIHQLKNLMEALRLMDEAAESKKDEQDKEGFTLV